MKQITDKTVIIQGDKTFQPVEVEGVVYWVDNRPPMFGEYWCYLAENEDVVFIKNSLSLDWFERLHDLKNYYTVVAQSKPILDGIPVIDLLSNNTRLIMEGECPIDLNCYTLQDIEKANKISKGLDIKTGVYFSANTFSLEEIIEQINSIQSIEVDSDFNIISF